MISSGLIRQLYVPFPQDQNDVNPLFPETQYSAAIAENASPDTIVTQLIAVDTDEGSNGRPIYSITSITPTGNSFMIDSASGTVTTLGTFDREDFPGPYTIQVRLILYFDLT